MLRLLALILSVLTAVGLVLLLGWAALLICPALALATLVFSSGAADPSDLQEAPALHWHMTAPAGFR